MDNFNHFPLKNYFFIFILHILRDKLSYFFLRQTVKVLALFLHLLDFPPSFEERDFELLDRVSHRLPRS